MNAISVDPDIDIDLSARVTGGISIFFYLMVFIYPYVNFLMKDKPLNPGNYTFSNTLENCDKMIEIFIIFNFMYFMMWFFAYRGILFNLDWRLSFPVAMWVFGIAVSMILWIVAKYKVKHTLLAFAILLAGQSFALIAWIIYKNILSEKKLKDFTAFVFSGLGIGLATLLSFFSGKTSVIGFFEIIHGIVIGISLWYLVYRLPPLPSLSVVQLPFSEEEIIEQE